MYASQCRVRIGPSPAYRLMHIPTAAVTWLVPPPAPALTQTGCCCDLAQRSPDPALMHTSGCCGLVRATLALAFAHGGGCCSLVQPSQPPVPTLACGCCGLAQLSSPSALVLVPTNGRCNLTEASPQNPYHHCHRSPVSRDASGYCSLVQPSPPPHSFIMHIGGCCSR